MVGGFEQGKSQREGLLCQPARRPTCGSPFIRGHRHVWRAPVSTARGWPFLQAAGVQVVEVDRSQGQHLRA